MRSAARGSDIRFILRSPTSWLARGRVRSPWTSSAAKTQRPQPTSSSVSAFSPRFRRPSRAFRTGPMFVGAVGESERSMRSETRRLFFCICCRGLPAATVTAGRGCCSQEWASQPRASRPGSVVISPSGGALESTKRPSMLSPPIGLPSLRRRRLTKESLSAPTWQALLSCSSDVGSGSTHWAIAAHTAAAPSTKADSRMTSLCARATAAPSASTGRSFAARQRRLSQTLKYGRTRARSRSALRRSTHNRIPFASYVLVWPRTTGCWKS